MQNPWNAPPQPVHGYSGPAAPGAFAPISAIDSVKFVFAGRDWKMNVLLGVVLSIIPIAGPIALSGWLAEMHQRLVRRHPEPLPKFDFSDFVHYLTRGVPVFLVALVASLPFVLIMIVVVVAGAVFSGVLASARLDPQPILMFGLWGSCGLFLAFGVLIMAIFLNATQTRAELTEDFGQALNLGKVFAYTRLTWGKVLIKIISFGFVSIGLVIAGTLLCYVGLYPAIVIIQIASTHLRWQIYEAYLRDGGEPIALKAPQWLPSEVQRYQRGY